MISVYVHEGGATTQASRVDPVWLEPSSPTKLWVDLSAPDEADIAVLTDVFRFHPLSIEDARSALQFPKVEQYSNYLYLVLHGIDSQANTSHGFATRDIDFFLARNFLVTVHDGASRSIARLREACGQYEHLLHEGPVSLLHRIVDSMVDNYRPVNEALESRIEALEERALAGRAQLVSQVMKMKRELAHLRRVLIPQRDAIGRLA